MVQVVVQLLGSIVEKLRLRRQVATAPGRRVIHVVDGSGLGLALEGVENLRVKLRAGDLGAVLGLAATSGSVLEGTMLLFIYAMGLGLPLILVSVG